MKLFEVERALVERHNYDDVLYVIQYAFAIKNVRKIYVF